MAVRRRLNPLRGNVAILRLSDWDHGAVTTERPSYLWSTVCAWGLTISVVILGVCGAMAMFMPGVDLLGVSLSHWCVVAFAAMAALAVASANNAAAAAMHAISQPTGWHWPTLAPAILCAVGFAIASNVAVHLGWSVLTASASQPEKLPEPWKVEMAALFLCFAKPAMAWIIEGRRAMDAADQRAADLAEAAELSAIRDAQRSAKVAEPESQRPASQPFRPEVVEGGRSVSHVGQSVAGAVAVSATVAGVVADRPAEAASFQPPPLEQVSHSQQTWASREAHAAALLKGGLSQRAVVRETGLSRYMVGQIAKGEASAA